MDDRKIIDLFFERSDQAVLELSSKYGRLMTSVAQGFLESREDVEEAVNDAYLGIWNTIPPNRPENLRDFAVRILRNCAITRFKANTAAKRGYGYTVALEEIEGCFAAAGSPEEALSAKETWELIESFLSRLDRQSRILFVSRYYLGKKPAQIGRELDMSSHRVSVRLHRIRESLRDFLVKEGVSL